jgi:hypothetical protein
MKTSKITFVTAALFVAASLTFTSCKKKEKETQEPDNEQSTAQDNNMAENTDNDMIAMGSQLSENSGTLTTYKTIDSNSGLMMLPNCATISATTGTFTAGSATLTAPLSYTVDFGNTGCVGQDQRVRKGQLIFEFPNASATTKWYRNPGFKMVVKSNGYTVDGNLVAINGKTITNTTPNTNPGTNLTWSIQSDIQITKTNNEIVKWNCSRTKELTNTSDPLCYSGQANPINWTKAIVKLNGSSSGINAKGESFTAVATDLIRNFNCTPNAAQPHRHPFVSGTIAYTPGTRPTRTINYGNQNDCDFNATITINGQTYAITLP